MLIGSSLFLRFHARSATQTRITRRLPRRIYGKGDAAFAKAHLWMAINLLDNGLADHADSFLTYVSKQPRIRQITVRPDHAGFVLVEPRIIQCI